jgi:hypothetical protein
MPFDRVFSHRRYRFDQEQSDQSGHHGAQYETQSPTIGGHQYQSGQGNDREPGQYPRRPHQLETVRPDTPYGEPPEGDLEYRC